MDELKFYAPIEKADDEQRMVYGYASTEALDSQGEIVKKEALSEAIDDSTTEFVLKNNTSYCFRFTSNTAGCKFLLRFVWYEDLGV